MAAVLDADLLAAERESMDDMADALAMVVDAYMRPSDMKPCLRRAPLHVRDVNELGGHDVRNGLNSEGRDVPSVPDAQEILELFVRLARTAASTSAVAHKRQQRERLVHPAGSVGGEGGVSQRSVDVAHLSVPGPPLITSTRVLQSLMFPADDPLHPERATPHSIWKCIAAFVSWSSASIYSAPLPVSGVRSARGGWKLALAVPGRNLLAVPPYIRSHIDLTRLENRPAAPSPAMESTSTSRSVSVGSGTDTDLVLKNSLSQSDLTALADVQLSVLKLSALAAVKDIVALSLDIVQSAESSAEDCRCYIRQLVQTLVAHNIVAELWHTALAPEYLHSDSVAISASSDTMRGYSGASSSSSTYTSLAGTGGGRTLQQLLGFVKRQQRLVSISLLASLASLSEERRSGLLKHVMGEPEFRTVVSTLLVETNPVVRQRLVEMIQAYVASSWPIEPYRSASIPQHTLLGSVASRAAITDSVPQLLKLVLCEPNGSALELPMFRVLEAIVERVHVATALHLEVNTEREWRGEVALADATALFASYVDSCCALIQRLAANPLLHRNDVDDGTDDVAVSHDWEVESSSTQTNERKHERLGGAAVLGSNRSYRSNSTSRDERRSALLVCALDAVSDECVRAFRLASQAEENMRMILSARENARRNSSYWQLLRHRANTVNQVARRGLRDCLDVILRAPAWSAIVYAATHSVIEAAQGASSEQWLEADKLRVTRSAIRCLQCLVGVSDPQRDVPMRLTPCIGAILQGALGPSTGAVQEDYDDCNEAVQNPISPESSEKGTVNRTVSIPESGSLTSTNSTKSRATSNVGGRKFSGSIPLENAGMELPVALTLLLGTYLLYSVHTRKAFVTVVRQLELEEDEVELIRRALLRNVDALVQQPLEYVLSEAGLRDVTGARLTCSCASEPREAPERSDSHPQQDVRIWTDDRHPSTCNFDLVLRRQHEAHWGNNRGTVGGAHRCVCKVDTKTQRNRVATLISHVVTHSLARACGDVESDDDEGGMSTHAVSPARGQRFEGGDNNNNLGISRMSLSPRSPPPPAPDSVVENRIKKDSFVHFIEAHMPTEVPSGSGADRNQLHGPVSRAKQQRHGTMALTLYRRAAAEHEKQRERYTAALSLFTALASRYYRSAPHTHTLLTGQTANETERLLPSKLSNIPSGRGTALPRPVSTQTKRTNPFVPPPAQPHKLQVLRVWSAGVVEEEDLFYFTVRATPPSAPPASLEERNRLSDMFNSKGASRIRKTGPSDMSINSSSDHGSNVELQSGIVSAIVRARAHQRFLAKKYKLTNATARAGNRDSAGDGKTKSQREYRWFLQDASCVIVFRVIALLQKLLSFVSAFGEDAVRQTILRCPHVKLVAGKCVERATHHAGASGNAENDTDDEGSERDGEENSPPPQVAALRASLYAHQNEKSVRSGSAGGGMMTTTTAGIVDCSNLVDVVCFVDKYFVAVNETKAAAARNGKEGSRQRRGIISNGNPFGSVLDDDDDDEDDDEDLWGDTFNQTDGSSTSQ